MFRRDLSVRFLLILLFVSLTVVTSARADEKPNILFIFADDQCFDTIAATGNREIETPNLDRLVRSGTVFTHTYNSGGWNGAICVASRTMLMTGRQIWRANRLWANTPAEVKAGRFWPVIMKQAGYRTYFSGKWHVRANPESAFDVVAHPRPGMPNQTPTGYNRPLADGTDPWSPSDPKFGGFWKDGTHWSEVLANDGVQFLNEAADRPEPFFMMLAFNAPHDPRQAPQEYVDRYPVGEIEVPVNFQPEYPHHEAMGAGKGLRDEKLAPFPRTEHAVKVHRREYYAIITHMDEQIGRILEALKKTGKAENTVIVFSADHGLAVGQHGLVGKQNMYDHSVRVPMIVTGPGIPAGESVSAPIYLQSVMPTTLELAGVTVPNWCDFESLTPQLGNGSQTEQTGQQTRPIYGAYTQKQRMVTEDGWKLIVYPAVPTVRLYHVAEDPAELHDLADDPAQKDRIQKLAATLKQLQQDLEDPLELSKAFPELFGDRSSRNR